MSLRNLFYFVICIHESRGRKKKRRRRRIREFQTSLFVFPMERERWDVQKMDKREERETEDGCDKKRGSLALLTEVVQSYST